MAPGGIVWQAARRAQSANMKRSSWLDSLAHSLDREVLLSAGAREDIARLDERLFEAWNLGENVVLVWTKEGPRLRFLVVRHYRILEPFGEGEAGAKGEAPAHELITRVLAGPKYMAPLEFDRLVATLGAAARIVEANLRTENELGEDLAIISGLVTRYGVTLVRQRAVLLFDIVGFSLRSPLEQVAMLNSLSYSVNSAYSQLVSEDIKLNFARSTTGDGFYIWNRAKTVDANIALFKLMMLVLADNAVAFRKAKRFPVPTLRAAFDVGEHYEFYQVEALNPTTYAYIVGHVTIELARILEKALPGQILLGDFDLAMTEAETGKVVTLRTIDFAERTAAVLDQLAGLGVSGDRVGQIRCYLTGEPAADGGHQVRRYFVPDKHGRVHTAYNAKINLHLRKGEPIYLGVQHADLQSPGSHWPG